MGLTRDQIMVIDDSEREEVSIPSWGGSVWVRILSGAERDLWEKQLQPETGEDATPQERLDARFDNMRARSAVLSVCDAQGAPLFVLADAEWLGKKSSKALDAIWDVFVRLNGLRKEDIDALKKTSGTIPEDSSGLTSP